MAKKEVQWFESWFDTSYYHILYKNRGYTEAEQFINVLLKELDLPKGTRCLDLACGMGRHAVILNKKGLDVVGVDLSENSIQKAKVFENETLHFDVQDMREPYKTEEFEIIFNLFTSFGYFDCLEDNLKTLQAIHKMLVPHGKVIIDFMNAEYAINHLKKDETIEKSGIQFHLTRNFDGKSITKNIQLEDHGKAYSFHENVQALFLSDFEEMMDKVGLEIIKVAGDYTLAPFDKTTSERLILIAQKK